MILILCASEGKNLILAKTLQDLGSSLNIASEIISLTELELPMYHTKAEGQGIPPNGLMLKNKLTVAKGVIVVAPEYNGSIPPLLNNAIAWVSRCGDDNWRSAFAGKFAALATHSGGGGQKVLLAMRIQLEHLGCNVLARQLLTTSFAPLKEESAKAVLTELYKYSNS